MATFKIDNVAMTKQPSHIEIIPPRQQIYPTSGANKIIVQPLTPPTIEVRWGMDATYPEVVAELKTKRGRDLVHAISWTNEDGARLKHCNVVFPEIGSGIGPARTAVDVMTLTLEAINPMPGLLLTTLFAPGVLTVADGVVKWIAPAGGRILWVSGTIYILGTGAGGTQIQVSNGATDYLTTPGDFVVASGTRLMENQVVAPDAYFDRGDIIEIDVDAIPAGADSSTVSIYIYCLSFEV